MTEQQWLASEEPTPMLEFLRGKVSSRKLRLFAVACCRHVWECLPEHSRKAIEAAECYTDGRASRAELSAARKAIDKDIIAQGCWDCAMASAWYAAAWHCWEGVTGVVRTAAIAPRTPEWVRAVSAKRKTRSMHEAVARAGERSKSAQIHAQCHILRDMFSPFRRIGVKASFFTPPVLGLARQMYESRDFSAMPILADALQDADCDCDDILNHCRGPEPHVRGCWVVDLILRKK